MLDLLTARATTSPATIPDRPDPVLASLLRTRHENWAQWVSRHWAEVRVAEGIRALRWIAGSPRLNADACVTLGSLQPADVRVELLAAEPLPPGHPLRDGRMMFAVSALRNGRYRYAVNAPAAADDAAREWIVRVRPVRPLGVAGVAEAPPATQALRAAPVDDPRFGNQRRASSAREVFA